MLKKLSVFSDKCQMSIHNKNIKVQRHAVVHIVLIKARNLGKMNTNGKSSDPYCELSLGKEKDKSRMISKCINPEWRENFDFNWYKGFHDILRIEVFNKNYLDLPLDDHMGYVEFDLNDLASERTHHIWKGLDNGEGQIFILLTISGTTSADSMTNLKVAEDDLER